MTARDDYPEIANLTGYIRPIIDTKLRLELQRALDEIDRLREVVGKLTEQYAILQAWNNR